MPPVLAWLLFPGEVVNVALEEKKRGHPMKVKVPQSPCSLLPPAWQDCCVWHMEMTDWC